MHGEVFVKHFIAIGVLVTLALVLRLLVFQRVALDIYIHDTYWAIPLRVVGFWVLMGIATVWFLIAAYKLRRHSS